MALSNRDRIDRGFILLAQGLYPFFEREMKDEYGANWSGVASSNFHPSEQINPNWQDPYKLLKAMWDHWNNVFKKTLGHNERSYVSELMGVRNDWAHHKPFTYNDTHRALDSMARLLTAVAAADEADEVQQMTDDVLRTKFEEQRRSEERRQARSTAVAGTPTGGLSAWRDVVEPHPDVQSGTYQQAEFAADLWQVYKNEGSIEYRKPAEFFQRTYITDGLRDLLVGALRRLNGLPEDPVIQLQTNFGGGKTHSLLALFHLFSGIDAHKLPGMEEVLEEAGVEPPETVCRAVLVGNRISAGSPIVKDDGTEVRTLWGEIAWQLGGREAFDLVREDDEKGTNPGDALTELLRRASPCLVMIDEWVAYARQLHDGPDLPGGTFDTQFTFAQALVEAVKAVPDALIVISLPASDIEVGGQRGKDALVRLTNVIERIAKEWRPASAEESFEIVRRRLFQPILDDRYPARDQVIRAFSRMYQDQASEFPSACREKEYERRMKTAYPLHPELFDRLYSDWSSLERFQRTRGVLRLMAKVIHELWTQSDDSLLILPSMVPIQASQVQAELTRYLSDNWVPIIDDDVDGPVSLPSRLDDANPNLGRYSACRRVARTIFIGSVPKAHTSNPGISDDRIRLGCAQPGETVATFGDALRRLSEKATHLYENRTQYWYNTQPSVNRLAADRALQFKDQQHLVHDEIVTRLREEARKRAAFEAVHAVPKTSAEVVDEAAARLVILGPDHAHVTKSATSPALKFAAEVLKQRGDAPRLYRNMLVFLAPDASRLSDLQEAVCQYLAWTSIVKEIDEEQLDLDAFSRSQARSKKDSASGTVADRMRETFIWLLTPQQEDPRSDQITWSESRLQGQNGLAERAAKKLENDAELVRRYGAVLLRMELDKHNLWRGADHVSLKQVWEDMARYLYLPRLATSGVLAEAVQSGVQDMAWTENFAYAETWDEEQQRYRGLKAGVASGVQITPHSVLVKPQAARRQLQADQQATATVTGDGTSDATDPVVVNGNGSGDGSPVVEQKLLRFHGTVPLDALRMSRDAGQIAQEVVQHLAGLPNAQVTVTIEIQASLPDGAPDDVVRIVTENARTLKFEQFGFEEE